MWRDDAYLGDILRAIRKIQKNVEGMSFDDLSEHDVVVDAVIYQIIIIGEATRSISPELKNAHPEIPWQ